MAMEIEFSAGPKMQAQADQTAREIVEAAGLGLREEVKRLRATVERLEHRITDLERDVDYGRTYGPLPRTEPFPEPAPLTAAQAEIFREVGRKLDAAAARVVAVEETPESRRAKREAMLTEYELRRLHATEGTP